MSTFYMIATGVLVVLNIAIILIASSALTGLAEVAIRLEKLHEEVHAAAREARVGIRGHE